VDVYIFIPYEALVKFNTGLHDDVIYQYELSFRCSLYTFFMTPLHQTDCTMPS